jgi:hypothetical protein
MRALLTARERDVLGGEAGASENYVATVRSRVRTRLDDFENDLEVLAANEPVLYAELRAMVCSE